MMVHPVYDPYLKRILMCSVLEIVCSVYLIWRGITHHDHVYLLLGGFCLGGTLMGLALDFNLARICRRNGAKK